jgi:hypothetical protein
MFPLRHRVQTGPPSLILGEYLRPLSSGLKLSETHTHLLPGLRMHRPLPPVLPYVIILWCLVT